MGEGLLVGGGGFGLVVDFFCRGFGFSGGFGLWDR